MEGVSATNEVLTLFSTIREICQSVTRRVDNFRGNPQQFGVLKDELSDVEQKADLCGTTLEKYGNVLVTESFEFELINLQGMMKTMRRVKENVEELENKLSARKRFLGKLSRANRIADDISEHVQIVRSMASDLNEFNEKLKRIAKENDFFHPVFTRIPRARAWWHLDFSTRDTMEGEVKAMVVENAGQSACETRNVYGYATAVVGIAGMGGVGKTTALLGLSQDSDIREIFSSGGIYFLPVGQDTSPAKLVSGLKEIVNRSGGKRWSEKIDSNGSLETAVWRTSSWFTGRKALFILDDLWQTSSNQLGYFEALTELTSESPESHILISTRSSTIANETNARIEFMPRENTGREARGMFLASAGWSETWTNSSECEELMEQILELCGGVPLMLSIAGAQVRGHKGSRTASLKHLLHCLNVKRVSLPEEHGGRYPSCFNQAVEVSLETIGDVLGKSAKFNNQWDEYCKNDRTISGIGVVDFVTDCFRRLCVLPRNARVSEDVIFCIWGSIVEAIGWSIIDCLVEFHLVVEFKDEQGKSQFGVHDVILDYCKKASQYRQNARYAQYHAELLSCAWKRCNGETSNMPGMATADTLEECNFDIGAFWLIEVCERGRPWWRLLLSSSEELSGIERYLLDNLFRHLKECGRLAEAVGLLTHMGWTKVRVAHGGIIALNADFRLVDNAIESRFGKEHRLKSFDEARHGITKIWNMVQRAWSVIVNNSEALPMHAYGYLLDNERQLPFVERYLHSGADIVTGPWLKPKKAFWHILDCSSDQRVFRTSEVIVDCAMVKGGQMILAATSTTLFWINTETMLTTQERVIRDEEGSQSRIRAFCVSERKGILVLGFSTGEVELRNERNGNLLQVICNAHEGWVHSVAISKDGRTVVSGGYDRAVRLWDTESGSPIGEPLFGHEKEVTSVALSGDGRTIVSGSSDATLRLWDTESRSAIGEPLRGHEDSVEGVAISEDGRTLVSGSADNTVRLWDIESGSAIGEPLRGHYNSVKSVAISEDGRTVVSGSFDDTIRLWDTEKESAIGEPLRGHDGFIFSVALTGDGWTVLSGSFDKTVRLWEAKRGSLIGGPLRGRSSFLWKMAISGDGRTVVSGSSDNTVRLWDLESGHAICEPLRGHENVVWSVAISEDGRTVVSGSADRTVRLWDTESRCPIGEPLRGHEDGIFGLALSGDGRTVVSGSVDKTVRLWDIESGSAIGEPLRGHEDKVWSVAISWDGRMVVSGSFDNTIRLWKTEKGSVIGEPFQILSHCVWTVALSRDGRTIVSGGGDNAVRLWDTESGSAIGEPLGGGALGWDAVTTVKLSGDGRTIMSRSQHGTVTLWRRNEMRSDWKRHLVCTIPRSLGYFAAFIDGHQCAGRKGKLVCPLLGGVIVFELVEP